MRTVRRTAVAVALAAVAVTSASATASAAAAEPQPAGNVDVSRYLGDWYQVAAVPQLFEIQCRKNVRATYTLAASGNVGVRNTCDTWFGGKSTVNGEAKPLDATNARLNVSFLKLGGEYRFGEDANYIVAGLDPDYRWAFVTDSDRESGFVLSREPALTDAQAEAAREAARAAGIDPCDLRTTRQDGGARSSGAFC